MKKLITAIAVAGAAFAVQAASVSWGSGALKTPASADGGNSAKAAKATVSGSLWLITEAQYNTFLASYTSDGNMKAVYDYYTSGDGKTVDASKTGSSNSRTSALTLSTDGEVGSTYYAAVIYTTTATFDGASTDFYIANIASGTIESDMGGTVAELSTYYLGNTSGTATGGWQTAAVPEPTSGLLMLLGMAGLALRRRRA